MRLIKTMMVYSILILAITAISCKKDKYESRDTSGLKPPVEPPPVVDPTRVVFDNADLSDGWETVGEVKIETTGAKEGAGYIKNTIANGSDFMQFIRHMNPPLDTKLTTANGQFYFWWYISDVSLIKEDGQIEITSGGDADKEEYGWSIPKLLPTLKNGWNQVVLNFRDADLGGGVPDPSRINYFRIFFWTKDKAHTDLVTGIDDLAFRQIPEVPGGGNSVVIDNCDKLDNWDVAGGTGVIEATGQKEGAGYLKGTIKTGEDFMQFIKTIPTPIDTKVTMATGKLRFWFNVADVSKLKKDGQIQFTSSNDPDKNRVGWGLAAIIPTLKNGWNLMELNFRDGEATSDGGPDLAAMNFFKIFFWTDGKATADLDCGIDDITVVSIPPPEPVLFDAADVLDGWEVAGGTGVIQTTGAKEGTGYLQGTIKSGEDFMQFIRKLPAPINTKLTKENGQFTFWLNIADVSKLKKDGQIQVSSSGDPDSKRFGWPVADLIPNLRNGWNELTLDFNAPNVNIAGDGEPDLAAMNFFKIFFWTEEKATADLVTAIDGLKFKLKP